MDTNSSRHKRALSTLASTGMHKRANASPKTTPAPECSQIQPCFPSEQLEILQINASLINMNSKTSAPHLEV